MESMESIVNSLIHKGLYLKRDWIDSIYRENPASFSENTVFEKALNTDLCSCSLGLPAHLLSQSHSYTMTYCVVLQIQNIINIAAPTDSQFVDTSNRMLKLRLTDGIRVFFGIEHGSIPSLSVTLKPGVKIAVQNVCVVNGLLLLNASNTILMGGTV